MHTIVWTLLMLLSLVPCTFAQDTSRPFFGLLHSHTSFSDGSGTPADAYQSAKAAGLHSGMWPTPLSYRHVEELMEERGVSVDHATVQRWVVKYSPLLEEAFQRRKRSVWVSWLMDETYIKVKGERCYLYRAVDKQGQTIDFLLTEHRDTAAALRFLKKAIRRHGIPETITIDGSEANAAAIKSYSEAHGTTIIIRQVKYLNNLVEQDHRAVKRVTRPMLGFKSFAAAQDTLVGIELMHMIKKRQLVIEEEDEGLTAAELFYSLAAS